MITIIVIIVIILVLIVLSTRKEGYEGALIQLMAKGPQDTYLTGDAWKYIPWWYYGNYPYPYYMSTRGGYYTMPYWGAAPY